MINSLRVFLLSVLCVISFPSYTIASTVEPFPLCDGLKEEKNYKGKNAFKFLVEGKKGWVFISNKDFKQKFQISQASLKKFKMLQGALKEKGTELVLLIVPTRGMVHADMLPVGHDLVKKFNSDQAFASYKSLVTKLNENGIPTAGLMEKQDGMSFAHPRDHHWNSHGAKTMAGLLAEKVKTLPSYKNLEKQSFVTETAGTEMFNGSFRKLVQDVCGKTYPKSQIVIKKTVLKSASEGSLFNDTQAEIILAGTSFSTIKGSRANFVGFLKEALSADVLNMALGGGGVESSLLSYLNDPKGYGAQKPKIIIWEIPGFYTMRQDKAINQMTSAIYGNCEGKELAKTTQDVDKNVLFSNLDKKKISAANSYIYLKFDGNVKKEFSLKLKMTDGETKNIKLKRPKRYPHDGIFYWGLSGDSDGAQYISEISVNFTEIAKAKTVSAKICSY